MLITHTPTHRSIGRTAAMSLALAVAAPVGSVAIGLLSLALSTDGTPAGGFTAPVLQLVLLVLLVAASAHLAIRTLATRTPGPPRLLAIAALAINALLGLTSIVPLVTLFATLNQ